MIERATGSGRHEPERDGGPVADLDALSAPDHRAFADHAYQVIVGRPPTAAERDRMLGALLRGDAKTWLLGSLRYGVEGRARGVAIAGLRHRYLAQRLFRVPIAGPLFEWVNAVARLPNALRHFRALHQVDAEAEWRTRESGRAALLQLEDRIERLTGEIDSLRRAHETLAAQESAVRDRIDRMSSELGDARSMLVESGLRLDETRADLAETRGDLDRAHAGVDDLRARLGAISPPELHETLELREAPLADLAKERAGIPPATPIGTLSPHARYTLFESVFYESPAVAAKQRVYVPYLDRELADRLPFLDLGCGRGEFLRILREERIESVGVDVNPIGLEALRADGFDVAEQDLLRFLESDNRLYCGAAVLQVVEHLTSDQIERMLALVAQRLAPGAVLIVETPNPLSFFALGVFHTDPTHVTPLPPERMRYSIEASGFEDARTLFQARIPAGQFAGPDARAYYADYAIIARKPAA